VLDNIFLDTVKKYNLLKKKDKVILAVSGGPDSVCMFHLFCRMRERLKLNIVCAHFNHGLRKEADSDEEFVRCLCTSYKVKFVSAKKDVNNFFRGDSLEQTARRLRFDFFLQCSRYYKIRKIAIAHTRDDVIETLLMRIIRGSALRGMRAIMPKNMYKGMYIIRPLIEVDKGEVLKWLKDNNYSYVIDKTNFEDKFLRNKIRHKLIDELRKLNPNVENSLFNLSKIAAQDYDFIYRYAREKFNSLKSSAHNSIKLNLKDLNSLHPAIVNEIIRIAIENVKGDLRRLEFRHLEEIRDLIVNRPEGSIVHLPYLEVKKEENSISIKSLIL